MFKSFIIRFVQSFIGLTIVLHTEHNCILITQKHVFAFFKALKFMGLEMYSRGYSECRQRVTSALCIRPQRRVCLKIHN